MQNVAPSPQDISAAALSLASREELRQMSKPRRVTFLRMLASRLAKQPPPTRMELIGIREGLDEVYPEVFSQAYEMLSKFDSRPPSKNSADISPDSETPRSEGTESPPAIRTLSEGSSGTPTPPPLTEV